MKMTFATSVVSFAMMLQKNLTNGLPMLTNALSIGKAFQRGPGRLSPTESLERDNMQWHEKQGKKRRKGNSRRRIGKTTEPAKTASYRSGIW